MESLLRAFFPPAESRTGWIFSLVALDFGNLDPRAWQVRRRLDNASRRRIVERNKGRIKGGTVKGGGGARTSWLAPADGSLAWKMPGWSARVGEKLYLKLFLAYVSFTANSHPPPLEYPRKGMIPARPQIAEPSTYYRCNVFFAISHVSFTNASFLFFFSFFRTFSELYVFVLFSYLHFQSKQRLLKAFRNEE